MKTKKEIEERIRELEWYKKDNEKKLEWEETHEIYSQIAELQWVLKESENQHFAKRMKEFIQVLSNNPNKACDFDYSEFDKSELIEIVKTFVKESRYYCDSVEGYPHLYESILRDVGYELDHMPIIPEIKEFLLIRRTDDEEPSSKIVSEMELIKYIDEYELVIKEVESFEVYGIYHDRVEKFRYRGWQPKSLIEIEDANGNVILRGYGERE